MSETGEKVQCGNCGRWYWPKYLRSVEVQGRGVLRLCKVCRAKMGEK